MTARHRPNPLSTYTQPSTGPYARQPRCRTHPRRAAGCDTCRRYQRWNLRRQRLANTLGEPLTIPIEQVRDHLDKLRDAGLKLHEISSTSGVPEGTLHGILYKPARVVCRDNAHRILALPIPAPQAGPPTANLVPAIGTIRRVRALARLGWTYKQIVAASGSAIHRLDQVKDQEWVTDRFAAAVRTAYDALSMAPGPSAITARRAATAGWLPPLAWDDDTIDDPHAQPNLGDPDADIVDEIAVRRALAGEPVRLNDAERVRAIHVGLARQMTVSAVAAVVRMNHKRVQQLAEQAA